MTSEVQKKAPSGRHLNFFDVFRTVLLLFIIFCVSTFLILYKDHSDLRLLEGQRAPRTLTTNFKFSWIDRIAMDDARKAAENNINAYFEAIPAYEQKIKQDVAYFFTELKKRAEADEMDSVYAVERTNAIQKSIAGLDSSTVRILAGAKNIPELLNAALGSGILSSELRNEYKPNRKAIITDSQKRELEPSVQFSEIATPRQAARDILTDALDDCASADKKIHINSASGLLAELLRSGNLGKDAAKNAAALRKAKKTPVVIKTVKKDDVLIEKDKIVTKNDLIKLDAYIKGVVSNESMTFQVILSNVLLCLVVMGITVLGLWFTRPDMLHSRLTLYVTGVIMVLGILLNRGAMHIFKLMTESSSAIPHDMVYFALPLGLSVVLVTVLYGSRMALFSGFFVSVIAAMQVSDPFRLTVVGMFVCTVSTAFVRHSTNYRNFFVRTFAGTSLPALLAAVIYLWRETYFSDAVTKCISNAPALLTLAWIICIPLCCGVVTAILAQISIFILEWLFDVSTQMSLMTYSDYNHPLLKKLQLEAPGTYHHSLMVSLIAEQAAREIEADYIMTRACALFHDIGKLSQPEYFIENSPGSDKHATLTPSMSAMIILNHVKYGLELARKYKLKKVIRDAITEHHGSNIIIYFYKRAQSLANGKPVDPNEFRYAGPLPRGKEISIIMLADCCEAASRSLEKTTPQTIETLVTEIMNKKIRDGQLRHSQLTLDDFEKVRLSIIKSLSSMMHGRIEYPKDNEDDENDLFVAAGKNIFAPEKKTT